MLRTYPDPRVSDEAWSSAVGFEDAYEQRDVVRVAALHTLLPAHEHAHARTYSSMSHTQDV